MGYATITDGVVVAISQSISNGAVLYAGSVAVGWLYANNTFTPPSPTVPTPPSPTSAQIAKAASTEAILAGLQIASAGTPALNAMYSTTQESQANINAVVTYIMLNNKFPGNITTMPWADKTGAPHVFPDTATFNAFATAIADYVAAISLYGDTGGLVGSLPTPLKAII